jgi:tRNA A58 N-methylase Trm61
MVPGVDANMEFGWPLKQRLCECSIVCVLGVSCIITLLSAQQTTPASVRPPDVVYIPTPRDVVTAMLQMANVGKNDILYDLGSGDGRIVIAAVKDFGAARGVGVDIDEARIQEANENARRSGVKDRVEFRRQDLFETDLSEATVVALYLSSAVNLKLRPKLMTELKPGTRVLSHVFDMGDWNPVETRTVSGRMVYVWKVSAGR